MASTYSTNLAIELIGTGDQAGSWGNTTNTNLGTLIEQAISGYVTQAVSTGTDTTITIPNGATGVARNMYIELTGTGGTNTNLIVPANKKLYFIFNNTSSGQVTVKVSGQTGVSVPNKAKMILVSNGTDIVDATNYIGNISAASANITVLTSASATITNLIATSASITTLTNNPTFSAGTANGVLYLNGSKVATSGSALVFDGTNLGVGATPTSNALGKVIQNGQASAWVSENSTNRFWLGSNWYYNASGQDKYINNGFATLYSQQNGQHQWLNAPSGTAGGNITFTQAMTLDASGNLGIGTSSPAAKLHVLGSNLVGIFAGTNANTVYTEYRYNSTTVAGYIGNGSSILSAAADSDFIVRSEGALKFATNGNNFRAVIDSSGNLGLGVTPSAWNTSFKALQVSNSVLYNNGAADTFLGANFYNDTSGTNRYITSAQAAAYGQVDGAHQWYTAASGTAGNTISFTQAMTLDASGKLGIGVTSPSSPLDVRYDGEALLRLERITTTTGAAFLRFTNGGGNYYIGPDSSAGNRGFGTGGAAYGLVVNVESAYPICFGTNNIERARITNGGDLLVGTTTAANTRLVSYCASTQDVIRAYTPDGAGNTYSIFAGFHSGATLAVNITTNGNITNINGSYGTISDAKMKTDIVDAGSQWADMKAVRFRKFKMKDDPTGLMQLGVVAQELEQVSPGLVDEHPDRDAEGNDLGTTTKSVKTSVLLMKAAKALQEAMARIEKLEAEMAALKGA